ncbi:MAG: hypothetical protein RMI91_03535 [Gemmatales bacterium]|nr:hypothetical protein [Gemmatales bacterium]MDW7993704.1 hypothetical protein [Gemmatales bacterium]
MSHQLDLSRTSHMDVLGLDIGGANLKAASLSGQARSLAWPLWRHPVGLAEQLRELLAEFPTCPRVAVTMTAELCDCFPDKSTGVRHILDNVCRALPQSEIQVWTHTDEFFSVPHACERPHLVAAANWRALARFAARVVQDVLPTDWPDRSSPKYTDGESESKRTSVAPPHGQWELLLDVGSTTTDLIPLREGELATNSRSDWERIQRGELLYLGARRTPLCALVPCFRWKDTLIYTAAEYFADFYDALLMLRLVPEQPDYILTADGRPATFSAARQRLARMLCADAHEVSDEVLVALAEAALSAWEERFRKTWQQVLRTFSTPPRGVILAGEGEILARHGLGQVRYDGRIISLEEIFGSAISRCACAYAAAWLLDRYGNSKVAHGSSA